MTVDEFRAMALSFPEAVEIGHMGHPDFRVGKKIFATLGYPDDGFGMLKLMREQQAIFVGSHPNVFSPAKGKWGLSGSTLVALKQARPRAMRQAMAMAWRLVAPPRLSAGL